MKGEGDSEGESDLEGEGDSEGDGDPEGDGDLEGEGDSECEVGDAIAFDWTLLLWGSFCAGAGATGVLFGQKVISRFTYTSKFCLRGRVRVRYTVDLHCLPGRQLAPGCHPSCGMPCYNLVQCLHR